MSQCARRKAQSERAAERGGGFIHVARRLQDRQEIDCAPLRFNAAHCADPAIADLIDTDQKPREILRMRRK